jgi:hypothetical protein
MTRVSATTDNLRSALTTTSETLTISENTLSELEKQEDQIRRTQNTVHSINANTHRSRYILRGMSSILGYFTNRFLPATVVPQHVVVEPRPILPALPISSPTKTDEDYLLSAISANLTNIKRTGDAIGESLTHQNAMLSDLSTSVDRANSDIRSVEIAARRLINK